MEKDYRLLRPFDLEAAKRGEKICWNEDGFLAEYIGPCGMHDENDICIKWIDGSGLAEIGHYVMHESLYFRMAPLTWLEGRPVYSGDVLYKKAKTWGKFVKVTGAKPDGEFLILECDEPHYSGTEYADNRRGWLSWQKPKTTREGWVNLYSNRHGLMPNVQLDNGKPFKSYDNAMQNGIHDDYIGAIKIEWEE